MMQRLAAVVVSVRDHTHTQKPVECDWKEQFPQFVILLLHIFFQPELVVSSRHVYIASSLFVVTCAR